MISNELLPTKTSAIYAFSCIGIMFISFDLLWSGIKNCVFKIVNHFVKFCKPLKTIQKTMFTCVVQMHGNLVMPEKSVQDNFTFSG